MDLYAVDQLVDEYSPLALGRGVPESFYVDLGEVGGDVLETLCDLLGSVFLFDCG